MAFKDNMRAERARKGMSQPELAEELGTSVRRITQMETGKIDPKLGEINKMAEIFKCSTKDLI